MLSTKNPQINDEYGKNKIWTESGWTLVPLVSCLGALHRKWEYETGPRESVHIYIQTMASSVAHPFQPRDPMGSLHFWDSVFSANLIPSWHFFRQDDVHSENKYSVWGWICVGVGYVSERIRNTCRAFRTVRRYTALYDVTPLSLWLQLTEQETWQSTLRSHTAARPCFGSVGKYYPCVIHNNAWLLFRYVCWIAFALWSHLLPCHWRVYTYNGTYTGWLEVVWPNFGRLLRR
jgi:hypothetical protein